MKIFQKYHFHDVTLVNSMLCSILDVRSPNLIAPLASAMSSPHKLSTFLFIAISGVDLSIAFKANSFRKLRMDFFLAHKIINIYSCIT